MKKVTKIFLFVSIFLQILNISIVFAQVLPQDTGITLMETVFGTLPQVCGGDLTSDICIKCIGILKFLPVIFFIAIFYLVFLHVIAHIGPHGGAQAQVGPRNLTPQENKVAAIISIVLALVLLHSPQVDTALKQIGIWINIVFFIFALLFVRSIAGITGAPAIFTAIILFIVFFLLWGYIFSPIVSSNILACTQ